MQPGEIQLGEMQLSRCECRRRTGMVVKHTLILTNGGDISLQSIKKNYILFIYF